MTEPGLRLKDCLNLFKHFSSVPWVQTLWILTVVSVSALDETLTQMLVG